ncbi:MAG: C10 family peptidase [Bacteroidales bacterium]|nr:C10 family peptidase [Bacteroidales bacterium]
MKTNNFPQAKLILVLLMTMLAIATGVKANPVDAGKAQQVAKTFLNNNGVQTIRLGLVPVGVELSNVYVFATENSFVLVAADDCVQPILGYSFAGTFVAEDMPSNVHAWLQGYNDEIQYAAENGMRGTDQISQLWEDLTIGKPNVAKVSSVIAPLIQTKWNQNKYYNSLCPEAPDGPNGFAYVGCTATAMAQIMKFYNYPSHGIGSHSYTWNDQTLSVDFGATTYDWNNMSLYYNYYYDDGGGLHWLPAPSAVEETAVATLMYHCGVSAEMNYSGSGSAASLYVAASALKNYFNYSVGVNYKKKSGYEDAEWIAMVKNDLDAGRPLEYEGYNPETGGGHAFVCDGYNNEDFFHFNWGWGGHLDGYFSIGNLNPGDHNYSNGQGAIFGIQPSNNNGAPTNLTYTQNGRDVTFTWIVASGAASYNVYCDGNYFGNATSTTYSHAVPFGSHSFYVRSVNAAGELSLATNTVTVTVAYQTPVVDDLASNVSLYDVTLSWSTPDWCYPETPTTMLNYGDGPLYYSWTYVYYAHKYTAAELMQYANKGVYKVSTYARYPGNYTVYVYTNSNGNQPLSSSLAVTQTRHNIISNNWLDFSFDEPVAISGANDLWVVIKQEDTGQLYPTPSFALPEHNANALYAGTTTPTNLFDANTDFTGSWYINTYITDGVYTYNVYRDGSSIANGVSNTSFSDIGLSNGSYTYQVKTNYYAGETAGSNTVTAQVNVTWYDIVTSCEPSNGGSTTGAGTYHNDQSCTLTATSAPGYSFGYWSKDGTQVSTDSTYTFLVNESATYVAHFQEQSYTVSVSADPASGGSVLGGGTYTYGQSCTVQATPNIGYYFVKWTKNGTQVSTDSSYSFTVTESASYVAHFQEQSFAVSVSADPTSGGSVSGGGTYTYGQSCTVHATANTGYSFVNWTINGEQVATDDDYTFTVTDDCSLVAHFSLIQFQVDAITDPQNAGSITGVGNYDYGQTCTLSVEPYENWFFINWTENDVEVSERQSFSFIVEESHSFVAHLFYYDGLGENQGIDLNIFPNPVSSTFTVKASQPINRWEVFSPSGAVLYDVKERSDTMEFQMSSLPSGTYLLRLTSDNAVLIRKIVRK